MAKHKIQRDGVEGLRRLYAADLQPSAGIAVFCCDRIFKHAQEHFLRSNGFERFVTISIPGGAGVLAKTDDESGKEALERQLRLLLRELNLNRVVVISHSNCRWYRHNYPEETNYEGRILTDLRIIAGRLRKEFPDVTVDGLFYADRHENHIRMYRVS